MADRFKQWRQSLNNIEPTPRVDIELSTQRIELEHNARVGESVATREEVQQLREYLQLSQQKGFTNILEQMEITRQEMHALHRSMIENSELSQQKIFENILGQVATKQEMRIQHKVIQQMKKRNNGRYRSHFFK